MQLPLLWGKAVLLMNQNFAFMAFSFGSVTSSEGCAACRACLLCGCPGGAELPFWERPQPCLPARGACCVQVWAVGEYASPSESPLCSPQAVGAFFEVLECQAFELLSSGQHAGAPLSERRTRLLCIVITSLSKVGGGASRRTVV